MWNYIDGRGLKVEYEVRDAAAGCYIEESGSKKNILALSDRPGPSGL